MHRKKEDNTVFVLQKTIRYFKINIADITIKNFLLTHPYYPSLKCICDALDNWKIKYYALNLDIDEIENLNCCFIAHLNIHGGRFVFVEDIKNNCAVYFMHDDKPKIEKFDNFSKRMSGAVLILDPDKFSGDKEYKKVIQNQLIKKSILPLGILTLITFTFLNIVSGAFENFLQSDFPLVFLLCTKLIGIIISIFLITHDLKLSSEIQDKICSFSFKTDCNTVLDSKASKIFGWLGWADMGLIYFIGTFLFLFAGDDIESFSILSFISLFTIPYPVYSIYYQSRKAKKWCPLCLSVQVILIIEFIFLFPFIENQLPSGIDFLRFFFVLIISATFWIYFKAYFNASRERETSYFSLQKFKRDPKVFIYLLKSSDAIKIPKKNENLIFGNLNPTTRLTAFLSLNCTPCAKTFNQIKSLLDSSGDFGLNIIFLDYGNNQIQKVVCTLYYTYEKKGSEVVLNFLDKWYALPKQKRNQYFMKEFSEDINIDTKLLEENQKILKQLGVHSTPVIFINGYKFPSLFELDDIKYFRDELKILNGESKKQEACANCH